LADERDDFSQDEVAKPTLLNQAMAIHDRLSQGNLEDIHDLKRRVGFRVYRFGVLLITEINRTELTRRAAALTYTTILSLFPLLAVISAFAAQFYTQEKESQFMSYIEQQFLPSVDDMNMPLIGFINDEPVEELKEQQKKVQDLRQFFSDASNKFRENAGGVGIFGFIGLLVTAGILYYSIESVVNLTWQEGVGQWTRTLTNFVTTLVFAPIVIGLSIAATGLAYTLLDPNLDDEKAVEEVVEAVSGKDIVPKEVAEADAALEEGAPPVVDVEFEMGPPSPEIQQEMMKQLAESRVEDTTEGSATPEEEEIETENVREISPTLLKINQITKHFSFMVKLIPALVNTLLLALAYAFLPKTKVRFRWALLGALIAALLWEVARYLFVYYLYWSSVNRSLADAFGLAVVFLIWVYITWLILLLGNLLVYLMQNFGELWNERRTGPEAVLDSRLYLAVMILLGRQFIVHGGGYTQHDLRLRLGINQEEFRRIIARLVRSGHVSTLKDGTYMVAHPPEQTRARDLLAQGCNLSALPIARRGRTAMSRLFDNLEQRLLDLCDDKTLLDLIQEGSPSVLASSREKTPRARDRENEPSPSGTQVEKVASK
jgi:uncharacterized BrkB/YihY/UPF0761 family membrane protein/DNA-binding IscR family transcriptional regulator